MTGHCTQVFLLKAAVAFYKFVVKKDVQKHFHLIGAACPSIKNFSVLPCRRCPATLPDVLSPDASR